MKKGLIIALAAAAGIIACSKVETAGDGTRKQIRFSVVNHLQRNKAHTLPFSGLTYPTDVPFGTFAWWTQNDWTGIAADQDNVFIDNEKVSYQLVNGRNAWTTSSVYYWTKSGKLTFASYSPWTAGTTPATDGFAAIPSYNAASGWQIANYTIVDSTNVDLMYADLAANCTQDTNLDGTAVTDGGDGGFSGVPTIFNHALCRLSFALRALGPKNANVDSIVVTVNDVDIQHIKYKGSFSQSANPRWSSNAVDTTGYDFAPESPLTLELIPNTPENVAATDNYIILPTVRILLPQTLLNSGNPVASTDDQLFILKYTVKIHYKKDNYPESDPRYWSVSEITSAVRLYKDDIPAWKDNQSITYRITINPYTTEKVFFDPAVVSWEDVYSSDIIID